VEDKPFKVGIDDICAVIAGLMPIEGRSPRGQQMWELARDIYSANFANELTTVDFLVLLGFLIGVGVRALEHDLHVKGIHSEKELIEAYRRGRQ
jgi:hypothetical protein